MLRSQRILVVVGLVAIAWLLHVNACEWEYQRQAFGRVTPILQIWTHEPAAVSGSSTPGLMLTPITALHAQGGVDKLVAVIVGLVIPLSLLTLGVSLALGWRARGRLERGLCPVCRYDMRGQLDASDMNGSSTAPLATRCPECGWKRA